MEVSDIYGELPTLETERLWLRKMTPNDVDAIFSYASNEEVTKYVTWPVHRSHTDSEAFVQFVLSQYEQGKIAPWGIEHKQDKQLIGTVDFVSWQPKHQIAELGYALSHHYWGLGLMTEAANELLALGFKSMDLVRIQARCFCENIGSRRVMEKIGMSYEGTLRKGFFSKGQHYNLKLYSILKEEFLERTKGG